MPTSDPTRAELLRWDREHVWHAFTQMAEYEPLVICRAQGCTLVDLDGREYLDGTSSLWCNLHGHRHPRLDAALRAQLDQVAHTTNLGASNPTTIRLARRLVELTPSGLEHVFFSDDGATAVEVALKLAFQYWRQRPDPRPRKTAYLAFDAAYHGDTLGSVSVGGVERFHAMFRPLLFDVVRAPAPDADHLPPGLAASGACEHYLAEFERLLAAEHGRLAAVVIEPLVQCAAGMLRHPPGFLAGVRRLTRQYDVLLVADEVAVGFGRTGKLFACEHEEVSPDLLCLAKGLTGGYLPMAATLATSEIWRAFLGRYEESKTFFHGHTYGGNPLGAAVALASLEVFEEERTLERVAERAEQLARRLVRLAEHPHVGSVRQRGLIAGVELVRGRAPLEPYPWEEKWGLRVCEAARQRGVLLRPLGSVLVIMPPLAIRADELERICQTVEEAIDEVCGAA
ncbi:MAG: adenosylmethionine--8-amino-7-oxononanoate transaminase [Pirellulales bacterium]